MAEGRPLSGSTPVWQLPGIEPSDYDASRDKVSLTANEVRYQPVYVSTTITFDALGINVEGAAGGGNSRFGLYEATTDWQPTTSSLGTPIFDSGSIATNSTGVKTATAASPITLPPGRYVMFIYSSGTPTLRVGRGGGRYMGYDITLSSALLTEGLVANKNFATSPPTTVTPYATLTTSGDGFAHSVFMRVSTP